MTIRTGTHLKSDPTGTNVNPIICQLTSHSPSYQYYQFLSIPIPILIFHITLYDWIVVRSVNLCGATGLAGMVRVCGLELLFRYC